MDAISTIESSHFAETDKDDNDIIKRSLLRSSLFSNLNCDSLVKLILPRTMRSSFEIEEFFKFLPNLSVLDLNSNELERVPASIGRLAKLSDLNLSNNRLCQLHDDYGSLNRLRRLNLSNNRFTYVPDCIRYGMPIVAYLDLSRNLLIEFNYPPSSYKYLRELNISRNDKMQTPIWIWYYDCYELRTLNAAYTVWNWDIVIDNVYGKIKGTAQVLEELNLCRTGISEYSSLILRYISNLKILNIGNDGYRFDPNSNNNNNNNNNNNDALVHKRLHLNSFGDIPKSLLEISSKIVQFNFSNVSLFHLDSKIDRFENMRILDLSDNHLLVLPKTFSSLTRLKTCILSRNELISLSCEVEHMISLEELHLDGNQLSEIPVGIFALKNLKYLDLYDNRLSHLPLRITELNLCGADISCNRYKIEDVVCCNHEFIEKYNRLRDNLRTMKNITKRTNDLTVVENENESYGESANEEDCTKYSSNDSLYEEDNSEINGNINDNTEDDMEKWDDEDNMDDNYVPADVNVPHRSEIFKTHYAKPVYDAGDGKFNPQSLHPSTIEPFVRNPFELRKDYYDDDDN